MARAQWLEEAQRAGRGDFYAGKRREPRFVWERPLEVRVVLEGNQAEVRRATSRTLSDSGIGFTCPQPIEPSAKIEVFVPGEPAAVWRTG